MRSNLAFIRHRVAMNLAESGVHAETGEGVVLLKWTEWPAGTTVDRTTGSKVADAGHQPTERELRIEALMHFPDFAKPGVRQFNEIEVGDCIIDVAPDAPLDGKENLRFIIAGTEYVQKPIGSRLASSWDVIVSGIKLFRPVLLRKNT